MKGFFTTLFAIILIASHAQKTKTENVVLITLDGMRWQEIFNGPEDRLIIKKFVGDSAGLTKKYAGLSIEERRQKLMPFFWSVINSQGQLYGNRKYGNKVNTSNQMWFSYPGYNEILTGFANDVKVNSNDPVDNPNSNVLEFINAEKSFHGKVAAYTSWETFPWILNTKRNGLYVNAGWMKSSTSNPKEELLNELCGQLPNITGGTRLDALTFHYAFEYLKKTKPKVLYLSFDETDHFAHEGNYDKYLASANYIDGFIAELWQWLQSDAQYKNKTTLIVTTDHGRGHNSIDDWRHHGKKMPDADQIWFAFLGPDTKALGEIKTEQQLYQNQIAKTLASFLNLKYSNTPLPGDVVSKVIE
jgi:hypothetical protein